MCETKPKKAVLKFDKGTKAPPESENATVIGRGEDKQDEGSASMSGVQSSDQTTPQPMDPAGSTLRRKRVPEADETGETVLQRRRKGPKKVTKAAAAQQSMGFADAWAAQNQGRLDVWLIIGLLTILTPFAILAWGVQSGAIPTGGAFD